MFASDVMTTGVLHIKPETEVSEISQLMNKHRISAVPVLDENQRLVGIVSEGDLIRRQELHTEQKRSWWLSLLSDKNQRAIDYSKSHAKKAADIMTTDVLTVKENTSLQQVANLLETRHIKRVPVLRGQKMVGIVSRANLIRSLAVRGSKTSDSDTKIDDQSIRDAIIKQLHDELGIGMASLNVIVEDGVAHLWGMVDGSEERKAIRIAAENTPGVKKVEDHLVQFSVLV